MLNRKLLYASHILARLIIYSYVLLVAHLASPIMFYVIAKIYFKNSYVAKIDTPKFGSELTKIILEDFNRLEDNKIIHFEPIPDGRPIEIYEQEPSDIILGEAIPRLDSCKIYLNNDMDYVTFRETLIHEYLHCMGYGHSYDRNDVMFSSLVKGNKEENIKAYAESLRNRFYGK